MKTKNIVSKLKIWQCISLFIITIISIIYALPNIYGEDPSIQITLNSSISNKITNDAKLNENQLSSNNIKNTLENIKKELNNNNIKFKNIKIHNKTKNNNTLIIHFYDTQAELVAKDLLQNLFDIEKYDVSLQLAPAMPSWLNLFAAKPMKLGLDLRGGVRFLMNVDIQSVLSSDKALKNPNEINVIKNSIMERTITTIRNRINELGVSEAIVQRQGSNSIIIELPGLQDTARAKNILGKTATLQFVMVDNDGILGPRNRFLLDRHNRKILVKKRVILHGDAIIGASAGFDSRDNKPIVSLRLTSGDKINLFKKTTTENVGKLMAIIYKEHKNINPKSSNSLAAQETIISVANIQGPLGNSFQISGLNIAESRDLALLLRSGAMPANVSIVEESIIGPSLGQANIKMGIISVILGLSLVLIVMIIYYRLFGFIANIALILNLILLVAAMSIIEATLTLPGIAGIVLTLGMAVDANVLIFERIKEELRLGASNIASINRGFDCAFSTIIDSNLTTLIVGIILFFLGTGPVKGFAVVLSVGIITSLFSSITGTRAMLSILYEGKYHLKKILVGI